MKTILLILLLTVFCYGQETYTYLIDMKNFDGAYSVNDLGNKGLQNIAAAGGQPFRITRLETPNTAYVLITITPKDNSEKILFATLNTNNFIIKISSGNVVANRTRFGDIMVWESIKFNDLPNDFYIDFSVIVSTP